MGNNMSQEQANGDYYEGCTYGECKVCGMSLEDEEGDEFCDECTQDIEASHDTMAEEDAG